MHYAIAFVGTLFVVSGAGQDLNTAAVWAVAACAFVLIMLRLESWFAKQGKGNS